MRGKEDPTLKIGEENRLDTQSGNYVWALKDINLEVKEGEVLGIIGKNGAGKSTLLKILSRVTGPSEGVIRTNGRIASLLEVGTGMHPELTGRENIFLNGAILGMTKQEIKAKFDEIVDFAGVARYIDTPVKRYSSGMHVRLGFAVAAFLEPEILIVDEVLAVGDAEFQKKAIGKMQDVSKGQGRTVLFVSHNMASVENLCKNVVVLENGGIAFKSTSQKAINYYLQNRKHSIRKKLHQRIDRRGNGKVMFHSFSVENIMEERIYSISSGEAVYFVFELSIYDLSKLSIDIGFSMHTSTNQTLSVLYSSYQNFTIKTQNNNKLIVKCKIEDFPFSKGLYTIGGRIVSNNDEADWPENGIAEIEVTHGDFYCTGNEGFYGTTPILIKGDWIVI